MNLKMSKKAFIFLPDGVGLRNFALTNFNAIGTALGYEMVYWNNTPFKIKEELGYDEVNITNHQLNPWTTVYTRARKRCELNVFDKKYGVILNQCVEGVNPAEVYCNENEIKILGKIMFDPELGLINSQGLIATRISEKYKNFFRQLLSDIIKEVRHETNVDS